MSMEFEELQQIWNSQDKQPLYAINEEALHRRIEAKKRTAYHITTITELLLIIVNFVSGSFILGMNFTSQRENTFMYVLAAWMFGTALYSLWSRILRIRGSNRFDRSMRGDLNYAISVATYQVRLSQLMRWNILPIGALSLLGMWDGGKSGWAAIAILMFFLLAYFASGWEHNIYKSKKRELEILQGKLENEHQSV
jgi:hypothetical protein